MQTVISKVEKWSALTFFDVNKIYNRAGLTMLYTAALHGRTNVLHALLGMDCSPPCTVMSRNLARRPGQV